MAATLLENENAIADDGYKYDKCVTIYGVLSNKKLFPSRIVAGHETCNARIKSFNILHTSSRRGVDKHWTILDAIPKIVEAMIDHEQLSFDN